MMRSFGKVDRICILLLIGQMLQICVAMGLVNDSVFSLTHGHDLVHELDSCPSTIDYCVLLMLGGFLQIFKF